MNQKLFLGLATMLGMAVAQPTFAQTDNPCGTDWINARYGEQHPERMQYREQMRDLIRNTAMEPIAERSTVVIPTVVHVMHRGGPENISDGQVHDALRILNTDLRRQNGDTANTRPIFKPYGADFNVEFRLAKLDPQGNCTNGITHNFSPITYSADDAIKETNTGGIDPWPVNRYFNIWVVGHIVLDQSGVIGYAYFPSWGMSNNYGVVIDNRYFGTIGTAQGKDGRTLTHEMGHCLELYHTFQSGCGSNCSFSGDDVCDTPPVSGATYNCSFALNSCDNDATGPSVYGTDVPDMIENYMSYNQNFCQNTFTLGQKSRSDAVFQNTFVGQLITAQNRLSTGTTDGFVGGPCALEPDFTWSKSAICVGDSIQFNDFTQNGSPDTWQWTISGPETLTSTLPSPRITFTQPGTYSVTLTIGNGQGNSTESKPHIIYVSPQTGSPQWAFFDGFENQPLSTRWTADNLPNSNGWEEKTLSDGNFTVYVNNVNNTYQDMIHELYSPAYDLTGITEPKIRFRTAYAQKSSSSSDRLKMFISADCGTTWILRYSKAGDALASIPATSAPIDPVSPGQWAHWESLVPEVFADATHLMVKFTFETGGGNNLYLDDINLMAASSIKESQTIGGLVIAPNPVTDRFTVDLGSLNEPNLQLALYDMGGRRVMARTVAGGSSVTIFVGAEGLAPGMYRVAVTGKTGTLAGKIIVTE